MSDKIKSVMNHSIRLRLSLVLLALLPGLLFQAGESLRVCLHGWIDCGDGCEETAALVPTGSDVGSCCSENEEEKSGPTLAAGHECDGCCIELSSDGGDFSVPPPAADADSLCPAAPVHHVAMQWVAPPVRRLELRTVVPAPNRSGRAPTPLRI